MSEENDNGGTVQSTIIIVTKKGETYEIVSFDTKKEFTEKAVDRLNKKQPFVFPIRDPNEGEIDIILPHDTIYSLAVKAFSALKRIDTKV